LVRDELRRVVCILKCFYFSRFCELPHRVRIFWGGALGVKALPRKDEPSTLSLPSNAACIRLFLRTFSELASLSLSSLLVSDPLQFLLGLSLARLSLRLLEFPFPGHESGSFQTSCARLLIQCASRTRAAERQPNSNARRLSSYYYVVETVCGLHAIRSKFSGVTASCGIIANHAKPKECLACVQRDCQHVLHCDATREIKDVEA
jgi:hypothetical protein